MTDNKPDTSLIEDYLNETKQIIDRLDLYSIQKTINILEEVRHNHGRLFILGLGGGAGNASHAVNDFRKLCGIESYAPTDNVSELTARANDEGWNTIFESYLEVSRLTNRDAVMVFSVGGGDAFREISRSIIHGLSYAQKVGARILGIVGRDGGYTAGVAQSCIVVPTVNNDRITPHTEELQAVLWHLIVWSLKVNENKWESLKYIKSGMHTGPVL